MKHRELTGIVPAARNPLMESSCHGIWRASRIGLVAIAATTLLLGGCVSINAPDKPIVIELNISITQDVAVRLEQDAEKTIDAHKDVF
ncbi:MAG: hypothetical protein RLZZ136_472 [Pseudomonadota bacterium]